MSSDSLTTPQIVRFESLQIPVRLTPPILVNDIGEGYTADWPKPPHRISDRQQGIGVRAGRQSERGLCLLLELQV